MNNLTDAVYALLARQWEAIERICEIALQTGTCGVRIDRHGCDMTVRVDPDVPYGEIYEYQS